MHNFTLNTVFTNVPTLLTVDIPEREAILEIGSNQRQTYVELNVFPHKTCLGNNRMYLSAGGPTPPSTLTPSIMTSPPSTSGSCWRTRWQNLHRGLQLCQYAPGDTLSGNVHLHIIHTYLLSAHAPKLCFQNIFCVRLNLYFQSVECKCACTFNLPSYSLFRLSTLLLGYNLGHRFCLIKRMLAS